MKLYTEKELRKAMTLMANKYSIYDEVFEQIVPIELPSDDEIIDASKFYRYKINQTFFQEGAKWMREQILKQNETA